jgi:hypothetical protein
VSGPSNGASAVPIPADDEFVTGLQLRTHVLLTVEPIRAAVREYGDRVSAAVHSLHALTADLQRQIVELLATIRDNHALSMRLHKDELAQLGELAAVAATIQAATKKRKKPKRRRK